MNVILVICDTLRADHIGPCRGARAEGYGAGTQTPYLDELARDAVVFDHAVAASFPTGPHRQDLHTGRFTFPTMSWSGRSAN